MISSEVIMAIGNKSDGQIKQHRNFQPPSILLPFILNQNFQRNIFFTLEVQLKVIKSGLRLGRKSYTKIPPLAPEQKEILIRLSRDQSVQPPFVFLLEQGRI